MVVEAIRDFRDLVVWQKGITLAKEVYRLTRKFPGDERFGLVLQVRRAVVSISSNIAEGHARQGREFGSYLSIARGSLAEVHSQLLLAVELGYLPISELSSALDLVAEIQKMLASLARRISDTS